MTKELELSKKLAVLGWIFRKGLIRKMSTTEQEFILWANMVLSVL